MNAMVKELGPEQAPVVTGLAERIWWSHYPGILSDDQIRYMLDSLYHPDTLRREMQCGVRYRGLHVAGQWRGFSSVRVDSLNDVVWLDKLYVLSDFHGQGMGQMLLHDAEAYARDKGLRQLKLRVNRHNHKAIRAYVRAGFIIEYDDCADIGNGYVMDDHVMALAVGA